MAHLRLSLLLSLCVAACADDSPGPTDRPDFEDAGAVHDGAARDADVFDANVIDASVPPPGDGGAADDAASAEAGLRWMGRVVHDDAGVRFAWSGSGFVVRFRGKSLAVRLRSESDAILLLPVIDGSPAAVIRSGKATSNHTLVETTATADHTVELLRQTEGRNGATILLELSTDGVLLPPPAPRTRRLEVVGDSISAGFGTLGTVDDSDCYATESHWDSYAARLARRLDAELTTIAASGMGITRNYGGDSAFTMREMYPRTLPNETALWTEPNPPDAVIINLGTNDISNNKGDPGTAFEQRYVELLRELRKRYPDAFLLCTNGPMLGGNERTTILNRIRAAVDTFADANTDWFDGIAAQTSDKFACAYHPNPAENELVAQQLAEVLADQLDWR